jgi:nitroreductase
MTTTADATQTPPLPPLTVPLEEAMRTQRARRRLRPDPADDALVWRLIERALKAPTGRNAQHWAFVLGKDRAVKARLARLCRLAWGLYGRLGRRFTASDPRMPRILAAVPWQVVVCPRIDSRDWDVSCCKMDLTPNDGVMTAIRRGEPVEMTASEQCSFT